MVRNKLLQFFCQNYAINDILLEISPVKKIRFFARDQFHADPDLGYEIHADLDPVSKACFFLVFFGGRKNLQKTHSLLPFSLSLSQFPTPPGALTLLVIAVPFVAPVLIPLGAWFAFVRARYLAASRDVKRLDGTTRSPVFAMLAETPRGLPTIRAYAGAGKRLEAAFNQATGRNVAWWGAFVG